MFRHHLHINAASWLGAEHSMQWQQLSSQIFLNSLLTHLSEAYPPKHGCPLSNTCWMVGLKISTLFPKEVWLLRQHHLLVVTNPRPQPNNLLALINTCLSLGSLASSSVAHGLIPLSEYLISTGISFVFHRLNTKEKVLNDLCYLITYLLYIR